MRARLGAVATSFVAIAGTAAPLGAQHAGHEHAGHEHADSIAPAHGAWLHVMGQVVPLLTRADPSAGGMDRTEATLTQALVMARGTWRSGHLAGDLTVDLEGLTMPGGEVSTGAFGEGFVDRRHPHTYLHEVVVTGAHRAGPVLLSASAGRGFAPFGTDDPMMRPFAKYPINHHLAQILERAIAIGAARAGAVIVEAGIFDGDEPLRPSSLPRLDRFGDSWAARVTVLPCTGIEMQGSVARVSSPEQAQGFGLDQSKRSASVRAIGAEGSRYLLAEWARTVDRDAARGTDAFAYESVLAEGALARGPVSVALRLEQTDRPEEERLADPFRVGRPATDLSISGITRWRVATLQVSGAPVVRGRVSAVPFLEAARLHASPRDSRAVFDPRIFYGTTRFWMLSLGARLRTGGAHARMGRYGTAAVPGPSVGPPAPPTPSSHHMVP